MLRQCDVLRALQQRCSSSALQQLAGLVVHAELHARQRLRRSRAMALHRRAVRARRAQRAGSRLARLRAVGDAARERYARLRLPPLASDRAGCALSAGGLGGSEPSNISVGAGPRLTRSATTMPAINNATA